MNIEAKVSPLVISEALGRQPGGRLSPAGGQASPPGDRTAAVAGVDQTAASPGEGKEAAAAVVERAVESLNKYVQDLQRDVQFSVHEDSGRTVVKVLNPETDEVIRQLPPEEVLALAERMSELRDDHGYLFEAQV